MASDDSSKQSSSASSSYPVSDYSQSISSWVEKNKNVCIGKLAEYVAIPSVSGAADYRDHVHEMMRVARRDFEEILGAEMKLVPNPLGCQYTEDGDEIRLPGILLGNYPKIPDKSKRTLLIYGHLDVMPAFMSDGWESDPWTLAIRDGKMYGRGTTDDKGPIVGWLYALLCLKEHGIDLPVNLKFCFEGMEETHSVGLRECLFEQNSDFFTDLCGTVISDNYWLGNEKPCLTYGLRGACSFHVTVEGASKDLHSGVYGGGIGEPLVDLISILHSLVDNKGRIQVEGIYDDVDAVTDDERKMYDNIEFDEHSWAGDVKGHLLHKDKTGTLMHRWRYPALSIHGIHGAHSGPEDKTVISRRVNGKFSIRTVASMDQEKTVVQVKAHVQKQIEKLNTPNKIWLSQAISICKPWYGNPEGFLFKAARQAIQEVFQVDPDFTREGCSIPIVLDFEAATQAPTVLIPMGASDDGAHSQNEKLNVRNYIEGIKMFAAFLQTVGEHH